MSCDMIKSFNVVIMGKVYPEMLPGIWKRANHGLDLLLISQLVMIGRKRGVYICTPMCTSASIASSNIVYLSTNIDPQGEMC